MRFFSLVLCLVALFIANIFFGAVNVSPANVLSALCGECSDSVTGFIVLQSRLPQAVTALLAGASLAVCGLLLQTLFHNPLAGPSVLGISGGAALGVAVVTLAGVSFLGSSFSLIAAALVGALVVTALLLSVSVLVRNNLLLLIVGLFLGYLISALITVLNVIATPDSLQHFVIWGMGNFSSVGLNRLPVFSASLVVLLLISLLLIKPLNILLLGDQYAQNLGINIRVVRGVILLLTGCLTAVVTAFCGPVSFIGLAVPHFARMLFHTDNQRILLPATILSGSLVALLCNLFWFLPLNAVTPIIGVPVIIYVLLTK